MTSVLSTPQIIDQLKVLLNKESDKDLADLLNIDRQSIYQYKQKEQVDIQQRIISVLINEINQKGEA